NFEPARRLIHDLFMDHVMSKAPGYQKIKSWVSSPIRPTPAAFGNILAQVSRDLDKAVLAIDLGGATTDVFSAVNGKVFRTVSANLGMSYSIRNVAEFGGIETIKELHASGLSETEVWNRIGNKHLNPTRLPATPEDMMTEWAVATVAIREAVKEHLHVMERAGDETPEPRPDIDDLIRGPRRNWRRELHPEGRIELVLQDYDLVIGSGGILSHSPREAAAMILIDSLQPAGAVELAVDSAFMFPHLGVLAEMNADLASKLFYELGIVRLGTAYSPFGTGGTGPVLIGARASSGRSIEETISDNEVRAIELSEEEDLNIVQAGEAGEHTFTVRGGTCGLIVDTRPRPIVTGAESLLRRAYVPEAARVAEQEEVIVKGAIRLHRELAIPGEVFVDKGDDVATDTLVARSARQFLRPFFIEIANSLGVPPEETEQCLVKGVGEEIGIGDLIAKRPRRGLSFKTVRSNVRARIERILPNGTLVARELPEQAREYTTVKVADDLGKPAWQMKPYLRVQPGDAVERGQWLAADVGPRGIRYSASPVRGKVHRIDHGFGMVIIEPLLEELEVRAWLPGKVAEVSGRGCVVAGRGTVVRGIWGLGGETSGTITLGEPGPGSVVVRHFADAALLERLGESEVAGLVTGGLDLKDMLGAEPTFTTVITEGFGKREIRPEMLRLFEAYQGKLGLLDGTTQLRVGVRRPRVILPAV
ncbi:MAG: glutamate mutase L, partial [bacterium]